MIAAFVDTTVFVDALRYHEPALAWIGEQKIVLGVTPITVLEVIRGAKRSQDLQRAVALVSQFPAEYQTPVDFDWAVEKFKQFYLSHNVGMNDCLIAAVAHRLNVPLFTHNLKHIRPVLGDLAQTPY